jgi:anti-anti-sigma factor
MIQELNIQLNEIEKKVILSLSGRLDANTSTVLEKKIVALINDGHIELILNFSGIGFLSSAGMRLLLSITKKIKNLNGSLVLFGFKPDVFEVITMAGFENILNICDSEKKALQFVNKK